MSPRSTARLELAAAAILFSTGGAAIKAADFTGWQITCLRSGIAADRDLADRRRRPARGWTARQPAWSAWPTPRCLTLFVLANRLTTAANTIYPPVHRAALPGDAGALAAAGADPAAGPRVHGRGRRRAGALLHRRRPAGGHGAGSGAREPARAGQRGHSGRSRSAGSAGWRRGRGARLGGGGGGRAATSSRSLGALPLALPLGRHDADRLGCWSSTWACSRSPSPYVLVTSALRGHSGAGGVADPADRAGAEPGLGLGVPGRAAGRLGAAGRRRSFWAPRPSAGAARCATGAGAGRGRRRA